MNTNNRNYIAIIGDIIDSRKMTNREQSQKQFIEAMSKINKTYSDDIASKFLITLGDSFQGLLLNANNILNIIDGIETLMAPYKLRFAIGIGRINTSIKVEDSSLIDGPAYYNARTAMDDFKGKSKINSNILIHSKNKTLDDLINSSLSLLFLLKSSWTEKQKQVVYLSLSRDKTQVQIAEKLNIKQPSVNERLKSANYDIYVESFKNINKAFELYLGVGNEL